MLYEARSAKPIVVGAREAADMARVSESTIKKAVRATDHTYLPAKWIAAQIRIRVADLEEWIDRQPDV